MNWAIFYHLVDGKYELAAYGADLIPTAAYDKVLPVREEVAKQAHKLEYDGERLRLKEGESLLTLDELAIEQLSLDAEKNLFVGSTVEPELVEVEL